MKATFTLPPRPCAPTEFQRSAIFERLDAVGDQLHPTHKVILRSLVYESFNANLLIQLSSVPHTNSFPGTDAWLVDVFEELTNVARIVQEGLEAFATARRKKNAVPVSPMATSSPRSGSVSDAAISPTTPMSSISGLLSPTLPSGVTTPRSKGNVKKAAERDAIRCVVTGLPAAIGWGLDGAHVIAYGLAKSSDLHYTSPFWKMLEMFMGADRTESIWKYVEGKDINRLENLITLDPRIHRLFDRGFLVLKPTPIILGGTSSPQALGTGYLDVKVRWMGPGRTQLPPQGGMLTTLRDRDVKISTYLPSVRDIGPNEIIRLRASTDQPLPSRDLLTVHAALQELRYMVGMGERMNDYHRDEGELGCPASDFYDSDSESESDDSDFGGDRGCVDVYTSKELLDPFMLYERLAKVLAGRLGGLLNDV